MEQILRRRIHKRHRRVRATRLGSGIEHDRRRETCGPRALGVAQHAAVIGRDGARGRKAHRGGGWRR